MKVTKIPMKKVMQNQYKQFQLTGCVRDPCIPIIFLTPKYTIGDLKDDKPVIKIEHCPSDFYTLGCCNDDNRNCY